jgi:hypothetical protein
MFAGMSTDSGCSLIHPEPNEAELSDFISSAVYILFNFYGADIMMGLKFESNLIHKLPAHSTLLVSYYAGLYYSNVS